jgi:protein TonB
MRNERILCAFLVFLFSACAYAANDNQAGEQLLTDAGKLVDIQATDAKPFQLDIDFQAQVNSPQTGHFTLKWAGEDRWWRQISMGPYRQVEVRKGEMVYNSRNNPFTPLRIAELLELVPVFSDDKDFWQVKKIEHRVEGGSASDCVQLRARHKHTWNAKREVCIDPLTQKVLTDEEKDDTSDNKKEFADYQSFEGHAYPNDLKLFMNGSAVVKAKVVALKRAAFSDADFVPPPGAIERRKCKDIKVPVAIRTPDPAYPKSAAQNNLGGDVTVSVTVLPNGSVENVQLLESAGHEMAQVTQEIINTWKFKPAMCGNDPVTYDIRVTMSFRLDN